MKENNYKEMLVTLKKEVKKLDRIHNAIRKTTNEFASIDMWCFDDSSWRGRNRVIEVEPSWNSPEAEICNGKMILTPNYYFRLDEDFWSTKDLKDWSPKYFNLDEKDGRRHRPIVIARGVTETQADYVFIFTKRELKRRYDLFEAFSNLTFGKRQQWVDDYVVDGNGTDIEVDRKIKTELDLMTDEDVIFITATGWDQEDSFEIKRIDMWDAETGAQKNFGFTKDKWQYKETTEEFVRKIVQEVIELDDSNYATFWLY